MRRGGPFEIQPGERPPADKPIRAEDTEQELSPGYVLNSLMALRNSLGTLARLIENRGYPVDEYNTGTGTGTVLTLTPTYEYMPERIESVIVTGPPASVITVQLGDRTWNLVIPPAGVLSIAPLGVILGRSDIRSLTAAVSGQYTLELMGYGQRRFEI
jgi:hypothetical protein